MGSSGKKYITREDHPESLYIQCEAVHETLLEAMLYLRDQGCLIPNRTRRLFVREKDGEENLYCVYPGDRPTVVEIVEAVRSECW
jgi:hypothetical protein